MSRARPNTFVFALFFLVSGCAVPLLAGVDEDWKLLYSQALKAVSVKDYVKAEAIYDKTLHEAEVFGKNDIRVASTLQGLATLLQSEKKLAEAEDAASRAVAIYSYTPGADSMEYAQIEFVLAGILFDEGKYQPALLSLQRVLPLFDRGLGPNPGSLADATCMQGDVYRLLKSYASAEPLLKRCAELRSESDGIDTAGFGEAANSLAIVYQHLGKYKEADSYFAYASKIRERTLGIDSLELAETLEAHAILLHQLGRDADAKKDEKMAAAIRSHASRK